jgi:ABC-type multidrug transport system fused ATPase/permease subunit
VLVLGLVIMALVGALTTLAVQLHTNTGFTGASLVTLMGFGQNITYLVVTYTKLETSLGAIARLKKFTEKVEREDKEEETLEPSQTWPGRGIIDLRNVSASYR